MKKRRTQSEAIFLARLFAEFIEDMDGKRSPYTIIGYKESMRQFAIFAEEEKHLGESDFGLDFFTQSNVYEYVRWLKRRGVSDSTCNMRIGQLTAFLKYLRKNPEYRMYYLDIKEVTRMKVSKHRRDVLPLSKAAIRAIESVPGTSTSLGLRYTTLISLMYSTATRIDEILSIKVKDLKMNALKPSVTVIGKGRKARTLYIMKPVVKLLRRYILQDHGPNPTQDAYLFYSRTKGLLEKSSSRGVNKQLQIYAEKAREISSEVPEHIHSHQFRHSMATHLLEDGMNIYQISKFLGHESVQTTMIYLGFTINMRNNSIRQVESTAASVIKPRWNANIKLRDLF